MAIPDVLAALQASAAAVLAAQRNIFETRRQVFQSQAAVIREKRLQTLERCQKLAAVGKPGPPPAQIHRDVDGHEERQLGCNPRYREGEDRSALFRRPDRNDFILLFSLGMGSGLVVTVRSTRELAQIDVDDRGREQRKKL